jgi:hypothetical protein
VCIGRHAKPDGTPNHASATGTVISRDKTSGFKSIFDNDEVTEEVTTESDAVS